MKNKRISLFGFFIVTLVFNFSCTSEKVDDLFNYAQSRSGDLRLSTYITAHAVQNLLADEAGRREAISIFRCNGITKAFIEVYRSGLVIEKSLLVEVRDYFLKNGIAVVGGIATVPGNDFGVRQEGKLGWFNWQNPKTQADLKEVMQISAEVFDEFIVDDFLCTADTSLESKAAKGDRTWGEYRRDLLTELSQKLFIDPAKEVNPDIKIIIKYPQWYDRFHLFGYDLEREPDIYDKVWVGTESRGQYTQRYGFVQPYEGFINYRWIKDIAGDKIGGAWFDHGDCDEIDFIEQAYQTVLAGAGEIVIFNYFDFINGHKAHHLLRTQFHQLADLAKEVADNPVEGVVGYKPLHSDAGGDLYLMDYVGTLGVPLIPSHKYPENTKVIFLPTQAASDKNILSKVESSLSNNSTIIFTAGFLAKAKDGKNLAELAGIKWPVTISPINAENIVNQGKLEKIKYGLGLESNLELAGGTALLSAESNNREIPFFISNEVNGANVFTINTHTFSQSDFDKVGEVLLCPNPIGLLEIPESWSNTIRKAFTSPLGIELEAPARVTMQPLGKSGWVFHNYNKTEEEINFIDNSPGSGILKDGFTGEIINSEKAKVNLLLPPRSRKWLTVNK